MDHFKDKISGLYGRYERFVPVVSFFAGVAWDNLTINRIDQLSDNLVLFLYLIVLGILVYLQHRPADQPLPVALLEKYRGAIPAVIQFFFGGLISTYIVFYFQSASLTQDFLFPGVLILVLIANEFLGRRLNNSLLLVMLYFFVLNSFLIFVIPVILHIMNFATFLLAGLLSFGIVVGMLHLLRRGGMISPEEMLKKRVYPVGGLFLVILIFYLLNWIPPVPLSMKYGGVFHSVIRNDTSYKARYEAAPWYIPFRLADNEVHHVPGRPVYCYVAVFAPTDLEKEIAHVWQKYDEKTGEWRITDRLSYRLTGGREGGYRGYTRKQNLTPGEWRVEIRTDSDQLLGRVRFDIVSVDTEPELEEILFY
jgi:hypothetical protein